MLSILPGSLLNYELITKPERTFSLLFHSSHKMHLLALLGLLTDLLYRPLQKVHTPLSTGQSKKAHQLTGPFLKLGKLKSDYLYLYSQILLKPSVRSGFNILHSFYDEFWWQAILFNHHLYKYFEKTHIHMPSNMQVQLLWVQNAKVHILFVKWR